MIGQVQFPVSARGFGIAAPPASLPELPRAAVPSGKRAVGAISIVAHDLKGPLANLSLLVSAMAIENAKAPADRRTGLTQRAERIVDRLEQLLDALIDREREFGDPLSLVPGDHDLGGLVRAVVSCNEASAEQRYVRLQARVAGPTPIRGDGELLMQAVDNLVSNAIRHTVPGGKVIVDLVRDTAGGAVVRIRDEGRGMQDGEIARAFRPFVRLGRISDAPSARHGLGLWIVRLIAENHGGKVTAARNLSGRGMTFALHLPTTRC